MACETLAVYPEDVHFLDVRPNQTYIQTVEVRTQQKACILRAAVRKGALSRPCARPRASATGMVVLV